MESLLIERRIRNATHVVAAGDEGIAIGKGRRSKDAQDAQTCGRTRRSVVCCLFAVVGIWIPSITPP